MSALNTNGHGGNLLVNLHWLDAASDANGRFEIVALPGPGNLLVRAPTHDYIPLEVSEDELIFGTKGNGKSQSSRLYFPDALVPLSPMRTEKRTRLSPNCTAGSRSPAASRRRMERRYRRAFWSSRKLPRGGMGAALRVSARPGGPL